MKKKVIGIIAAIVVMLGLSLVFYNQIILTNMCLLMMK